MTAPYRLFAQCAATIPARTTLTNAFSKKIENVRAATSRHLAHYNFVRLHKTFRTTPAIAAQSKIGYDRFKNWWSVLLAR